MPQKIHDCQTCTPADGKVYEPVELAHEGARAKANEEFERYRQVRPALIEHRVAVETELRKASRGAWPPPHIVMDKLLQLGHPFEHGEFSATDNVLQKF